MSIKSTYLITNDDFSPYDDDGVVREQKTEKAAKKAAAARLACTDTQDAEVWIWKLVSVASKPPLDPEFEATV
jgi:hypothetical protein